MFTALIAQFTGLVAQFAGLVGLKPVVAEAGVGDEGDGEGEGALHLLKDDGLYTFFFVWEDGEVEFVVDLEDHFALDALGLEALMDANHGYLDDVGSGALNGGIDGVALGKAAHGGVGAVDVGQIATTSE